MNFGQPDQASVTCTTANVSYQLYRAPWPSGKTVRIKKLTATNNDVGGGMQLLVWDQDLSSSTPKSHGSASIAGAIFTLFVDVAHQSGLIGATADFKAEELPQIEFCAGIAVNTRTTTLATIMAEVEVI